MRKILLVLSLVLLLNLSLVSAITEQEINEARDLLDSNVSCDKLTNEQLEIIGEYYMEQMHPGDGHELMHKMMGLGEDSEAEKQFHISIAKRLYCNEEIDATMGMMGGSMMNMMMGNNMMGSGGMNMMNYGTFGGMMGSGYGYWTFLNALYLILLIGLIVLVYFWIAKLWKEMHEKKK